MVSPVDLSTLTVRVYTNKCHRIQENSQKVRQTFQVLFSNAAIYCSRPQTTGLPLKAMQDGPTKDKLITNASARSLSFSLSPPSFASPPQHIPNLQRRYSLSAEGKSLWATVTSYKFVTTEKDEVLLHKARQVLSPYIQLQTWLTVVVPKTRSSSNC